MVLIFGVIMVQYACPSKSECQMLHHLGSWFADPYIAEDGALARFVPRFNFTAADLSRVVDFNIKGDDVIVFLHIQKTGGTTFGRHLVRNIKLERPCECHAGQKKCTCFRPGKKETWLFSRFSTGWSCGLHADWTELTSCVPSPFICTFYSSNLSFLKHFEMTNTNPMLSSFLPSRHYYYITILRDPVSRYLSEWRHVQRGATWKASLHVCDGRAPTLSELPNCYPGDDWSGCSLQEFMDCPYNLANNRQTLTYAFITTPPACCMDDQGCLLLLKKKADHS
uniref:Heparan-sulfate 6-O-sulfotransferase n=1 Tax=Kryptolebias marmoratus TaxID=37003 RepID=A0A3Q3ESM8_KRYMA